MKRIRFCPWSVQLDVIEASTSSHIISLLSESPSAAVLIPDLQAMCMASSWPIGVKLVVLLQVCQRALEFCNFMDLALPMLSISMSPLSFQQKFADRPKSTFVKKSQPCCYGGTLLLQFCE